MTAAIEELYRNPDKRLSTTPIVITWYFKRILADHLADLNGEIQLTEETAETACPELIHVPTQSLISFRKAQGLKRAEGTRKANAQGSLFSPERIRDMRLANDEPQDLRIPVGALAYDFPTIDKDGHVNSQWPLYFFRCAKNCRIDEGQFIHRLRIHPEDDLASKQRAYEPVPENFYFLGEEDVTQFGDER